jgi:hypothetical protein
VGRILGGIPIYFIQHGYGIELQLTVPPPAGWDWWHFNYENPSALIGMPDAGREEALDRIDQRRSWDALPPPYQPTLRTLRTVLQLETGWGWGR